MNGADRIKLLNAGIRVFRGSKTNKLITELTARGSWVMVARYTTVKDFNQGIKDLRAAGNHIFENDDL